MMSSKNIGNRPVIKYRPEIGNNVLKRRQFFTSWDSINHWTIKVEDMARRYRPIFGKVSNVQLYLEAYSYGGCPFECDKIAVTKDRVEKHRPSPPKRKKYSYCECCKVYYSDLKNHVKSMSHVKFASNNNNFACLDACISTVPTLNDLVSDLMHTLAKIRQ